ncbi:hypothetical protein M231_00036 [Tremella mesenterica]|uniref:C2H2-type domain-containing protein n=1 Tax=Tremella mesenterica TaxID=5217 RepID=A0A4Q1BWK8_TREME|nr:hypothetical protein M231_00036 [Tremella mesenterica]
MAQAIQSHPHDWASQLTSIQTFARLDSTSASIKLMDHLPRPPLPKQNSHKAGMEEENRNGEKQRITYAAQPRPASTIPEPTRRDTSIPRDIKPKIEDTEATRLSSVPHTPMYAATPRSAGLPSRGYGYEQTPPPPQPRRLPHDVLPPSQPQTPNHPSAPYDRQPDPRSQASQDLRRQYEQQVQLHHRQHLAQAHANAHSNQSYSAPASPTQSQARGRYQPSRGAQRDARWMQRQAQVQSQTYPQSQVPPGYPPYAHSQSHMQPHPLHGNVPVGYHNHPNYPQVPRPASPRARIGARDLLAEQQAAIAQARKAVEESKLNAKREEDLRKTRRIQLQVFVHARPTNCSWSNCHAVLNSWALLEKHIYHAHLHEALSPVLDIGGRVRCLWKGCTDVFRTREEVYKHCLVLHMKPFSARCPFNCLYEGSAFPELMAHIGRRHSTATPDDFVPGLIHHRPSYLPKKSELPSLPTIAHIPLSPIESTPPPPGSPSSSHSHLSGRSGSANRESEKPDKPERPVLKFWTGATPLIRGSETISTKTKTKVERRCWSGHRPQKEGYATKAGARAAISAVIENSRRLSLISGKENHPVNPTITSPLVDPNTTTLAGDTSETQPVAEGKEKEGIVVKEDDKKNEGDEVKVDLIDIKASAKEGKELAKREMAKLGMKARYDDSLSPSSRSPSPLGDRKRKTDSSDVMTGSGRGRMVVRLRLNKRRKTGESEINLNDEKNGLEDVKVVEDLSESSESDSESVISDYKASVRVEEGLEKSAEWKKRLRGEGKLSG